MLLNRSSSETSSFSNHPTVIYLRDFGAIVGYGHLFFYQFLIIDHLNYEQILYSLCIVIIDGHILSEIYCLSGFPAEIDVFFSARSRFKWHGDV